MERAVPICAAGDRLLAMAKKKQCLCGFAFGDKEQKIYCQEHYQEMVEDRDSWKRLSHELLGYLEKHWRVNS